jgi:hypothetical protein
MNDKKGRTPEQRKAQAEALHTSIDEQVQQLAESEQWRRFLDFARSFHTYSLNNLLLILAQYPEATMVAGFRQWRTKGRQYEKASARSRSSATARRRSPAPTMRTIRTGKSEPGTTLASSSVFVISQTDPIDGATVPQNPIQALTGNHDHGDIGAAHRSPPCHRMGSYARGATPRARIYRSAAAHG